MQPIRLGLALLLALVATPAYAQFESLTRAVTKRGTTAADFLSIPVGARATAMGNAITASVDDATSIYWNPAGLAGIDKGAVTLEYADWLVGLDFNFLSVALPMGNGAIGIGLTSMRTPDMEVTTVDQQNGTGETFTAGSYALALSYARDLTDRFSVGGSVKVVNERIWNSSASGVAIDVGTLFITPFRGIRLGASITNFGSKMQLSGDDLLVVVDIDPNNGGNNESNRALLRTDAYDMPLTMRIGLAGEVFSNDMSRLTLAVDALNPNNSEQYINLGAELGLFNDLVMLRGGYSELLLDDALRSFTAGGGLRYGFGSLGFALDYAFETQAYFSGVNRFTFALQF
ncbi:MAG: PorV/PorQ family protein [Rhodothermales bacterium]|nr:PorV/PorQ family protein [Rhodothermales bacterium]